MPTTKKPVEVINLQNPRTIGTARIFTATYSIEGEVVVRHTDAEHGVRYYELCDHCDGTGYRPGYGFVDSGRCWPCGYSGLAGKPVDAQGMSRRIRTRATRLANQRRKIEERAAAAKLAHAAWFAALPQATRDIIASITAATTDPFAWERGESIEPEWAGYPQRVVYLAWQATNHEKSAAELAEIVRAFDTKVRREAAAATRTFLGAEKERVEFTGKVVFTKVIEGYYGSTTLVKFETADGNVATWFASGFQDVQRDQRFTVKGTVKALEDSEKYGKQTILTRCKLVAA